MMINEKNRNINKKEFIRNLVSRLELSATQVEIGVDGILNFLALSFKQDCIIEIRGFGKFICKNGRVRFKSFVRF